MQSIFKDPLIYIEDTSKFLGVAAVDYGDGTSSKTHDLNLIRLTVDSSKLKHFTKNALAEFIHDGKIMCVPIGRNNLGVQIMNVTVSRIHCFLCINPKTGVVKLIDLCSTNGTSFYIKDLTEATNYCKNLREEARRIENKCSSSSSGSSSNRNTMTTMTESSSNNVSMVVSSFYTRGNVEIQFTRRYEKFSTLCLLVTFAPRVLHKQETYVKYIFSVKQLRSKFMYFLLCLTKGKNKFNNHVVPYKVRSIVDISTCAFSTMLSEMLGCKWKEHFEII